MPHRRALLVTLATLSVVGLITLYQTVLSDRPVAAQLLWWLVLVCIPIALGSAVWMEWTWAAMASVCYGTIGLALDIATMTAILTAQGTSEQPMLPLSSISGIGNFVLIVFGGRAFWSALQEVQPPGSRPPNPPSPASSSAT